MRIGFIQFLTNPIFPVHRMLKEEKHQACADDLHCRILVIEKDGKPFYHVSIDAVEIYRDFRERIKEVIEQAVKMKVDLVVSATHSHNCPCVTTDYAYQQFLLDEIRVHVQDIQCVEYGDVTYSYQYAYFDKVGNSRIVGQASRHIYAETLSFFHGEERIGTILIHNVHPTIKKLWVDDFTAEYPGYVLRTLQERYPHEFFTFLLGPAGDLSPRFVRKAQTYEEMQRLADLLVDEYERQLQHQNSKKAIDEWKYKEIEFPLKRVIRNLDNVLLPDELYPEEKEVVRRIKEGKQRNVNLAELTNSHMFAHLTLSKEYSIIFEPFELYSGFYDAIDKEHCSLITISNGFDHYVADLKPQRVCREVFDDTIADETKKEMYTLFHKWSIQEEEKGEHND